MLPVAPGLMIWTILTAAISALVVFLVVRLVVRLVRRSHGQA
jgi:hypothetical protein